MGNTRRITKEDRENYLKLLKKFGEDGLFHKSVGAGIIKSVDIQNIDIQLLNLSDSFLALFRTTGNEDYAAISRALRRAAHVIFRQLSKKSKRKPDVRFLICVS